MAGTAMGRQVTARNAPSVIGALFNREQFWDGRANHRFNGHDPFGTGQSGAADVVCDGCSLASQAVGPIGSDVEMACSGRSIDGANSLAEKLLARPVLQVQVTALDDGVLRAHARAPQPGLDCGGQLCTYRDLVSQAFAPEAAKDAQAHFARLFGQAVAAYEATLVPDATPLDRFLAGKTDALDAEQQLGLSVFRGKGRCTTCHAGPELSDASVGFAAVHGLVNHDGGDQGFHNIGVTETSADLGRASKGPHGAAFAVSQSSANRGAFKTPGLRNIGLTGPYFHDGSARTLAAVLAFYQAGGAFPNAELSSDLHPLALSRAEMSALLGFLAEGLTDCRVEKERGPFDHPSLVLPGGDPLPEVGASGHGDCP
jgi:cytochrome c peroxidase